MCPRGKATALKFPGGEAGLRGAGQMDPAGEAAPMVPSIYVSFFFFSPSFRGIEMFFNVKVSASKLKIW